jgi:3-phosphoshikimate 1-carboxyvinyltransferase
VVATQAAGTTEIRDAAELRVKESDRIAVMADGLRRMGASVRELPDGMVIEGTTPLRGIEVDALHDHRIAMSFAVAGLIATGQTVISGAESIPTSFPGFAAALRALGASVAEA